MVVLAFCVGVQCLAVPPQRYDHRYQGLLDVFHVSQSEVAQHCHNAQTPSCAVRTEGFPSCKIYINKALDRRAVKILMRHEIAHCNGWGTPQNQHPVN